MNANETLLWKDEVYLVVGCALEVINGIGHGLHELHSRSGVLRLDGFGPCGQYDLHPVAAEHVQMFRTGLGVGDDNVDHIQRA